MSYYASKVTLNLPTDVLKQLDAAAGCLYMSRSTAVRVAVEAWIANDSNLVRVAARAMGKTGLTRGEQLSRILTSRQLQALDDFKADKMSFESFIKHIPSDIYLKLLELGEI